MLFVVPGPEAPVSGGNRYNGSLIDALGARRVDLAGLAAFPLESWQGALWVDSLYLRHLPRIRSRARRALVGMLAHSLPSQLARAEGRPDDLLDEHERALLAVVGQAVAPSATMRDWLRERAPSLRVSVIEPAHHALPASRVAGLLTVLMVANLVPNKGVLPFLAALTERMRPGDRFRLRVIGRVDLDPHYASRCRAHADPRIEFTDGMRFDDLLAEYARAHVLVSASRSESYGMAIAEARASGCIVLARAGGHVAKLVDLTSSVLVDDDLALADAMLALARDASECTRRLACAAATRGPARSWSDVAREFMRV